MTSSSSSASDDSSSVSSTSSISVESIEPVTPAVVNLTDVAEPLEAHTPTEEIPDGAVTKNVEESGGTAKKIRKGLATALATLGVGALSLGI